MRTVELMLDQGASGNYFVREAFNTLRANILFSGKDVKVIVVTSCFAHEGKTSVSFDLCVNLAEAGKRVLLLDADLRKSVMVSRYTKEKGVYGLSQVLSGQVSAKEAVYATNVPNMHVMFAGPYPPNPTELVGSEAFKELLEEEWGNYDYIIVDAPPLGMVIDAAVMAGVCDGAVIVLNSGKVKYRAAQGVKAQLEKSGCRVLGVVLNQVDKRRNIKAENSYYYSSYAKYEQEMDAPVPTKQEPVRAAAPATASAQKPTPAPVQGEAVARPRPAAPTTAPTPTPTAKPAAPAASAQPTRQQPAAPVRRQSAANPQQSAPAGGPVRRPVPPAGGTSVSGSTVRHTTGEDEK